MSTVQETLEGAIEWTGARPLGDTPSDEEIQKVLAHFQNMLLALPPIGMAGQLTDVQASAAYPAENTDLIENVRLFNTDDTAITITLPTRIYDPGHPDADTDGYRPPRNGAVFKVGDATPETWLWVSYLGAWKRISGLTLATDQPLGEEVEAALRAMLGARICRPVFQKSASPELIAMAEMGRRLIRQRFRQPKSATIDPVLTRPYRTATTTWAG
jgi:hypothetical protein